MEDTEALEARVRELLERSRQARAITCDMVRTARKVDLARARQIGAALVKLKEAAGHGNWAPTLERLGLSERSASRYMRLADQIGHVADLPEPTTIRAAEIARSEIGLAGDVHHRHHNEYLKKIEAVDPALAEEVRQGNVTHRAALKQTKQTKKTRATKRRNFEPGSLGWLYIVHERDGGKPTLWRGAVIRENEKVVMLTGSGQFTRAKFFKEPNGELTGAYRNPDDAWKAWHTEIEKKISMLEKQLAYYRMALAQEDKRRNLPAETVADLG